MPKGEGQKGRKRGRVNSPGRNLPDKTPERYGDDRRPEKPRAFEWADMEPLVEGCPLKNRQAARGLVTDILRLEDMIEHLHFTVVSGGASTDDHKALVSIIGKQAKLLEQAGITKEMRDDDDEDDF